MTPLGRPPVLPDIVEEHFDELDFLWEVREANLFTSDWTLRELAEHEDRAEAHLDALRLAERHGVDLAQAKLGAGETSAATAAALVLWLSEDHEARHDVLRAFRSGDPPVRQGIRIAFRHLPLEDLERPLREAMAADPGVAAAAADVLTFHRVDAPPFDHLLMTDDASVQRLALGAAGRCRRLREEHLAAALRHADPFVRVTALRAAALAALPNLPAMCRASATTDPVALEFLGTLGDPRDCALLAAAVRDPVHSFAAITALGAMGQVNTVPLLLELISDGDLGAAAVAAYKRITGASDIEGAKPHPPPAVPEGEDEDEALPPDPVKATADWERRAPSMVQEGSYQSGMPIAEGALPRDDLTLESRRDLYFRLTWRSRGGAPDLELEALAARQRVA